MRLRESPELLFAFEQADRKIKDEQASQQRS